MKPTQLNNDWLDVRRLLLREAAGVQSGPSAYQKKKDDNLLSFLSKDDREFEQLLEERYAAERN